MNICIRVDASEKIGSGHVSRCLTLADMLHKRGVQIFFACRNEQGHLIHFIEEKGYMVFEIESSFPFSEKRDAKSFVEAIVEKQLSIDWVIVDHYQLSETWERQIRESLHAKIFVIDDLANRKHDCDLLLDQNFYHEFESRYKELVPERCKQLLGPEYLLLREEFYEALEMEKETSENQRVLVFFGGSDPTGETLKALRAFQDIENERLSLDVVVGLSNRWRLEIERLCDEIGARYHCQIDYIASLMRQADWSLGAGGVTMWERCYLGLPSIVTVVADNQLHSTEAAADVGAVWSLGWHEQVTTDTYKTVIAEALESAEKLQQIKGNGQALMNVQVKQSIHPIIEAMNLAQD